MFRLCSLHSFLLLICLIAPVYCKKKAPPVIEDVIELVDSKELASIIVKEEYVAVFFYTKQCKNCDKILLELENIDDDTDKFGVAFVKNNEKSTARKYGVTQFPSLVYFRNEQPAVYDGDLMDEDKVLSWLTDFNSMELPDEIEEVNSVILKKVVAENDFVAVLFYKEKCKECDAVLKELENIDDDADEKDISFVKICDTKLSDEYGLGHLPALVYYRKKIPLVYDGNLSHEQEVLEWLLSNRDLGDDDDDDDEVEEKSGKSKKKSVKSKKHKDDDEEDDDDDDDEVIEDVTKDILDDDTESKKSAKVLKELENIDDDAEKEGIDFVKIDDDHVAQSYGADEDELPILIYFEKGTPNVYQGDLIDEDAVLKWLIHQKNSDEIEDVTDVILEKMIKSSKHLTVLFYDGDDEENLEVVAELENIDDEADSHGLSFVKIDDDKVAKEYGIDDLPALVYFEHKIPNVYAGDLKKEEAVLKWLIHQMNADEIEDVTHEMFEKLVEQSEYLAVLFYDHSKKCDAVLKELENIDDDADKSGIPFVKVDDKEALEEYGIEKVPALVYFENGVPNVYDDDSDDKKNEKILDELENIDDDTDKHGIKFVKIDDHDVAKEYGIDDLPTLIYFENKIPNMYEGDLMNEDKVLEWLVHQKNEDTIEEVSDEILHDMIKEHEYVVVFFAPDNCRECDVILKELENIDDDTDDFGIQFVTTDDIDYAKKQWSIKKFPSLTFFRNGQPITYSGNLKDEDKVLEWLTSDSTRELPDQIEDVNEKMLEKLLQRSEHIAVLFYKEDSAESSKVLDELENIDDEADENGIDFVKINEVEVSEEYGLQSLPALIYFRKKFPQIYTGNLKDEEKVLAWLLERKETDADVIELVDRKMLEVLMEDVDHLVVFFYKDDCPECDKVIDDLEKIDDDTDQHGIHFVKTDDISMAEELGVTTFPSLVYFEDKIPSVYQGDLEEEDVVLEWLVHQKNEDTIENINRGMLFKLITDVDYLAVIFYTERDKESDIALSHLEQIDDECSEYGIQLVKTSDHLMAKKYKVRHPPGMVLFRKGKELLFQGDLVDEEEVLEWLTDPDNLELTDHIEEVNAKMFQRVVERSDHVGLILYSEKNCKQCPKILQALENIDDEADAAGIDLVKVDDPTLSKAFGIYALPSLLFFKYHDKEPNIFTGDLKSAKKVLDWLLSQKDPQGEVIEEVEGDTLQTMINKSKYVAVYFYKPDCKDCNKILEELENIDDDTDRHGIHFVKTVDLRIAREYGVRTFPSLVYFESSLPSIYEGDLSAEEEVLQWLVQQKTEDTIETVNRDMLETLVEGAQYLAVYFYKNHCKACDQALLELENIDDDLDVYGISLVKIQDNQLAKRYGIKTFPALVYFRNGNPLVFDDFVIMLIGDLKNEDAVLEWLIDDDNRELADEIESVNSRMLVKLIEDSPFLAVLFYEDDCDDCVEILAELENIDEEADMYGIDMIKINDPDAAMKYNIINFPTFAYFRRQEPILYEGDLLDEMKVLNWLTSQEVFQIKDEIEEVNRKMLDKILDENDFVVVYFYEPNCEKCDDILEELERIDDDTDELDILFVKIKDVRYSKKYGIHSLPGLVYFRRKFPSIYRGDLMVEEEVLEWLKKNRYRNPELNLFMYALAAISATFVVYTIFLMFCFRKDKRE
ncbi:putative protein disulfide-isomerase C1F5.02 [Nymphon striatum]|nr:putative protein disulfide-isomerase C1F5.02 [Nymphon striatum]